MSNEHLHEKTIGSFELTLLLTKTLSEGSVKVIKKKVEELEPLDYSGNYRVENFKSDVLSIIDKEIDRLNKDYYEEEIIE